MKRTGWMVIGLSAGIVAAYVIAAVILYRTYAVSLDYPQAPPVPPGSTVLAEGEGWDNDDPIRTRAVVVDSADEQALLDFYRQAYPELKDVAVTSQALCLVKQRADYTEVVDVWAYEGTRVPAQPGRYLVSSSRYLGTGPGPKGYCGHSGGWLPIDLVTAQALPG